jgi:tRNA 2-thiouridine synthesizing protein A
MATIISDIMIDARGLNCPRPLLMLKKSLDEMQPGQILKVLASDEATKVTFPPYLRRTGDKLLAVEENGNVISHYIEKSSRHNQM